MKAKVFLTHNLGYTGRGKMSRIAIVAENSIGFVEKLIDIWNDGDCAVLIDCRIPFKSAVTMMKEAGVKKCFLGRKVLADNCPVGDLDICFEQVDDSCSGAVFLPKWLYDRYEAKDSVNEAIIIYSSGTTGKAKGVVLSHRAISLNADAINDYMKLTSEDCVYIVKSLTHSSSIVGELLVALKTGTKVLLSPTVILPRCVFENIKNYKVTILCVNPTLLRVYAEEFKRKSYDLSSLRSIYVSGSILSSTTYTYAKEAFVGKNIYNVYGLSEAGPRVTAQTLACCHGNSVGKPLYGVEVNVLDAEGNIVSNGVTGLVCVRTPSIFLGYVGDVEMSLHKGWLNTGDMGYIDDFGELHIVGRVDDMITVDSHNIYPNDIEELIINECDVTDCVVVKISNRQCEYIACLYAGEDTGVKIRHTLNDCLPAFEIPRKFVRCDSIPYNSNGKVSRAQAIEMITKEVGE